MCPNFPLSSIQAELQKSSPPYLDSLELGDGCPKGLAIHSIVHSTVEGSLGDAQSLGSNANSAHVQGLLWGMPQSMVASWALGPHPGVPTPAQGSPWLS